MFSATLRWKSLELVCRSLATMLHSGIDVRKAFDIAANRTGDARCSNALRGVSQAIARGKDVSDAMLEQRPAFPELVIDMVNLAERTGNLPEVLQGLADHYENNIRLRRTFVGQIAWPLLQLVAAVLIVAIVIWVLGMVPSAKAGEINTDLLGFGLRGEKGALIWLGGAGMIAATIAVGVVLIKRSLTARQIVDPLMMKVPVVGGCLRAFALARFSWAYYLTQQTGMPIHRSLSTSLRATGNGAFQARTRVITDAVKQGESLSSALALSHLFPEDYLHMVQVAESSGTVPETLHRLSPQLEDQARRSLSALTTAAGWMIWAIVAGFIVFLIFRIFSNYISVINDLTKGI